jgi:Ca2+-dependent lipid-binding protein
MDFDGTSDPYIVVECSGQQAISKYQRNTLNPIWEEDFAFDVE